MRTFLVLLAALAPLPGLAPAAPAHIGDQIYPFYELLDEDLHRIDLTDGSIEDWYDVLGEASLTAADFYYPYSQYDCTIQETVTFASGSAGTGAAAPSGSPWSASMTSTTTTMRERFSSRDSLPYFALP